MICWGLSCPTCSHLSTIDYEGLASYLLVIYQNVVITNVNSCATKKTVGYLMALYLRFVVLKCQLITHWHVGIIALKVMVGINHIESAILDTPCLSYL